MLIAPGLPSIKKYFDISAGSSQYVITLFLLGYALAQPIYGPIANRLGRKRTISIGVIIYLIGNIISYIGIPLNNFSLILIGRFIAALGAGVGLVMTFTIINDFYHPHQARSVTAYATLSFAVMPGLSMCIGGLIVDYLGWIYCFYFYFLYGIVVWLLCLLFPETLPVENRHPLTITQIISRYKHTLGLIKLLIYSATAGLTTVIIYLTSSFAPFISIVRLKTPVEFYAWLILIPSAGYFLGNIIAAKIVRLFSAKKVIIIGLVLTFLSTLTYWILYSSYPSNWTFFIPMGFVYLFIPMIYTNSSVLAMMQSDDKANASAVMSFINMGITVFSLIIGSIWHTLFVQHLSVVFLITLGICALFFIGSLLVKVKAA